MGYAKVDPNGNKRTLVTAVTFLRLNGYGFRPDPLDGVRMVEALAAGEIDGAAFVGGRP